MTARVKNSDREGTPIFSVFDQHDPAPDRFCEKIEPHDQRISPLKKSWKILIPRRPATIGRDIPLSFIPRIVKQGVLTHGEEPERVFARKTCNHSCTVSIGVRPITRELKRVKKDPGGTGGAYTGEEGRDRGVKV